MLSVTLSRGGLKLCFVVTCLLTCPPLLQGLALRASQHPEGKLVEPVTGEVFEWDDLKKVGTAFALPKKSALTLMDARRSSSRDLVVCSDIRTVYLLPSVLLFPLSAAKTVVFPRSVLAMAMTANANGPPTLLVGEHRLVFSELGLPL